MSEERNATETEANFEGGVSVKSEEKGTNPWADLVVAMLSVNNYPMTKTFDLFDALESCGFFDPRKIAGWDEDEIGRRLDRAGYNRGAAMTAIFSRRLASLGLLAGKFEENTHVLQSGTREEVRNLLATVKGVGPRVLSSFLLLRG